jgi:hypothetical protein
MGRYVIGSRKPVRGYRKFFRPQDCRYVIYHINDVVAYSDDNQTWFFWTGREYLQMHPDARITRRFRTLQCKPLEAREELFV